MSIRRIPDRFLNTTIYIYRDTTSIDEIGDLDTVKTLAYYSVKANIQSEASDVQYEIQGRIHYQTDKAYINRVEDSISREIHPGDYVWDMETGNSYVILGIQMWQAANRNIGDSHHYKLILKRMTGITYSITPATSIAAKGRVQ